MILKIGGIFALAAFLIDRLNKWWFIEIFDLPTKGVVEILPIFDVVMVWNKGISFGFLPAQSEFGRWALIVLNLIIVAFLTYWLKSVQVRYVACAIGLVIGGAIGNIYDRVMFGAVADFFQFHAGGWYFAVFNVADSFIFIGAMFLIFNTTFGKEKPKQLSKEE